MNPSNPSSGSRYAPSSMFADRYELGAQIGRGGMAEVFEASARGAHGFVRRVAIKRLLPGVCADAHLVRMFLDEARIASYLHHAGIVAVLDYGVVDDVPFQVLELVEGWDAARLVRIAEERGARMPVEIAMLLATEVAHALAYAHERADERGIPLGIVHRDVKPSNILVSKSGDVKLGDFGIALARERSAVTTSFVARGTPGFMAPEQLFGGAVGPAADVFAVGITLHGLITGYSPLKNDPQVILSSGEIPLAQDLPLDVRSIIHRAVRLRPDERYRSARQLAQALGEMLAPRLETDSKSRMTAWLASLDARSPERGPGGTAILVPAGAPGTFATQRSVAPPAAPTFVQNTSMTPSMTPGAMSHTPSLVQPVPPGGAWQSPSQPLHPAANGSPSRMGRNVSLVAFAVLVVGALLGTAFVVVRHREAAKVAAAPDAQASAQSVSTAAAQSVAPSAVAAPSTATSTPGVTTRDAGVPRVDAGASPSRPTGPGEIVVSSVNLDGDGFVDNFADRAAAKRTIPMMEAAVRGCAVGKRVWTGSVIEVQPNVLPDGSFKALDAYQACRGGASCNGRLQDSESWVPPAVIACVQTAIKRIRFPPLKPGFEGGVRYMLDFLLR